MTFIGTEEESERRREMFNRGFGTPRVTTLGPLPTVVRELAGELDLSATAPRNGLPPGQERSVKAKGLKMQTRSSENH